MLWLKNAPLYLACSDISFHSYSACSDISFHSTRRAPTFRAPTFLFTALDVLRHLPLYQHALIFPIPFIYASIGVIAGINEEPLGVGYLSPLFYIRQTMIDIFVVYLHLLLLLTYILCLLIFYICYALLWRSIILFRPPQVCSEIDQHFWHLKASCFSF